MIEFTIPGAPVAKGRPRIGRVGGHARMFTPEKTARYESTVALAAQQAIQGRAPLEGAVIVRLVADVPIPASWSKKKQAEAIAGRVRPTGRPDLDNLVKAVSDGCNGILWRDDSQVVTLTAAKRYAETPGVFMRVEQVT